MGEKIKVLIVDDAAFMRKAIADVLGRDPEIEVVGTARNGLEGLKAIKTLRPDVITLDIDMPVMDGLTGIRHSKLAVHRRRHHLRCPATGSGGFHSQTVRGGFHRYRKIPEPVG